MQPFHDQVMEGLHTPILPDQEGINRTHLVDVDATNAHDLTWATVEGRRQAHHLVEVFREVVPGMGKCYLIPTAPALGSRASHRIEGEVTPTAEDIKQRWEWKDALCYGSFLIDIYNPAGSGMSEKTWRPPRGFRYHPLC
jgi:hypothetical protein